MLFFFWHRWASAGVLGCYSSTHIGHSIACESGVLSRIGEEARVKRKDPQLRRELGSVEGAPTPRRRKP